MSRPIGCLDLDEVAMDRKTRSKLRALYVFEAAIFAYLAGTAVVLRELIAALVPE